MQDTGAATPPVRLFRKILPESRGDFPQETQHELDRRSGAQLPSHVHFCSQGTGSCHCHRVQVPEFRGEAVSSGGRCSGASAPRTGHGREGSRRAGAAGERPERECLEAHACLRAGRRHGERGSGKETGMSGLWILSTQKVPGFSPIAGKDFSARSKIRQS